MHFPLDNVLKNQAINDSQKENIRHTLFECRYSRLNYNKVLETNPSKRIPNKYEISDDESIDLNKSINESIDSDDYKSSTVSDELNDLDLQFKNKLPTSLYATSKTKDSSSERAIKDVSTEEIDYLIHSDNSNTSIDFQTLTDYDKRLIELEDKKRSSKFQQALTRKVTTDDKSKQDSLSSKIQQLKEQQKALREPFTISIKSPETSKASNAIIKPKTTELSKEQVDNIKEIQQIQTKLTNLSQDLKSLHLKCLLNENKTLFEQSFLNNIKQSIQSIENTKELKNRNELNQIEQKYSKLNEELKDRINSTIKEHQTKQKEQQEKEAAEKKQKQDKLNQDRYLDEINKYKTKYFEVKTFLEHLIKKLETKKSLINNLANKSLNEQVNELEMSIKSHVKDVDSYVNKKFDKYKSILIIEQTETFIDNLFVNLNESLVRFVKIGQEYDSKLTALDQSIQKDLLEQQSKRAEEQQRAELIKQKELEVERKRKEEEVRRNAAIKQEELNKRAALLNEKKTSVQNVNNNDKNGINNLTLTEYESTRNSFEKLRNEVEEALSDKNLKLYKYDLQKAINFPLNSLMDDKTNEDNVRNFNEKIRTLIRLLNGQTCSITSTLVVNPTKHPSAITFCLVYLARKLVEKAEETVASRPETAFQYVQLIKEVFKQCPQFETILLGQMQEKCPFVVPFYKQRLPNQTDTEYFESLGYKTVNGKLEDDILYFKRMNGVLHLYFTLLVNTANFKNASQISTSTNHFSNGYKKAWQWLSDVLNLTPRPDTTAEMLAIFFKCCGYQLQIIYGKQFLKLISVCSEDFFPLIKSIPRQSGASIGRLQTVFDDYKRHRQFAEWKSQ